MNELARWQEGNEHYLAAALSWLRLRLARQANPSQPALLPAAEVAGAAEPARPAWWNFGSRTAGPAETSPLALPAPSEAATTEQIAQAAESLARAEAVQPPPALLRLSQRLGLSRFERETLLLCAAMELDTRTAGLCAAAQADPKRPYPTFALALALFDEPAWDVLSPERPLRFWRLIEINQPGAQPLTTSPLRADERVVNYLKGLNYLDDRLAPLLTPLDLVDPEVETAAGPALLPPSQQSIVDNIVHHLRLAAGSPYLPVLQLLGSSVSSKQLVARQSAAALGLRLYRLPAELLPAQPGELESLARLWERESSLLPLALYLDAHELERAAEGPAALVSRFLARCNGVVFLDVRDVWPGAGPASLTFDVAKPSPAEQQAAWAATLGDQAGDSPAQLAGQFNLGLAAIRQTAQTVLAETPPAESGSTLPERLWRACLMNTRPRLDTLAQRLDPKATWVDIVLPAPELALLRQIAGQVGQRSKVYDEWGFRDKMNRGLGINALFAGESGVGKTMAAEVIAQELRLNLYRIDLSAVVNKYIGETEKNLRRLFDAAEDGGAILFFDEADALFGKRSEVRDSHDRYANIEINYLLQRMEAYRGLAILATNMKSALDEAFMRRLRFIVNFPFPGPAERELIWQKVFPAQTPAATLDYERLARLKLTGGSIHNIALNAAFLAAQAGAPVTMPLVLAAARAEFRKLERPVNEADFRWEEPAGGKR
jgi:hypothetical protein